MKKKVKYIEQNEHSECGLACVAMLLKYYGIDIGLTKLRSTFGVPNGGNNFLHLQQILSSYGISAKAYKVENLDYINKIKQPMLIYWERKHFIILEKITKKFMHIVDPSVGRIKVAKKDFMEKFSNVILNVEKVENISNVRDDKSDKSKNIYSNLKNQILKNKLQYISMFIITLLLQISTIVFPVYTQKLIDSNVNLIDLKQLILMLSICLVVYFGFQVSRSLIITFIQKDFSLHITRGFVAKLTKLPISFFINRTTGDILYKFNLINYIQQILSQQLLKTLIDLIFVIIYLYVMINYSIHLTMITLIVTGLIAIFSIMNTYKFMKININEMTVQSKAQSKLVEMIEGMETVKSLGIEGELFSNWEKYFIEYTNINYKKYKINAWLGSFTQSFQFMLPFIIIIYGLGLLNNNVITIGLLISFPSIASSFLNPIAGVLNSLSQLFLLKSYLSKVNEVIEQKEFDNGFSSENISTINSISLNNVCFKYSYFEHNILKDVTMNIGRNEKIAIVGPSGSGKSTLLKIISGLYDATEGCVTINDNGIKDYSVSSLRKKIGYLNQNPMIFNSTILENIVLDDKEIDNNKLLEVCYLTGIDKIIENLPLGIYTNISESGMNLSGGQKQKIALARSLYRNPDILLLDEPTSSLDNISEKYIVEKLKDYDMMMIVVSHRLSTISHFDKIVIMNDGEIIDIGSHEDLLQKCELYKEMYSNEVETSISKSI